MEAPLHILEPRAGTKPRYADAYRKGVAWAIKHMSDTTPDNARASIERSIRGTATFTVIRHLITSGNATDGPPQYRTARHLVSVAARKKNAVDSVSRSFWQGVIDVCNDVLVWWNENSDLLTEHYEKVSDELFDMFDKVR